MADFYEDDTFSGESKHIDIRRRSDLRSIYFEFLRDFKEYLIDFVQQSMAELVVTEMPIHTTPTNIFNPQVSGRYITVKNQGKVACFISTGKTGGFRLEPGEKERFFMNKPVVATTITGSTVIGIIQS